MQRREAAIGEKTMLNENEVTTFIVETVNVLRDKLEPILGESVVRTIMLSAKRDLGRKFPFLNDIQVEDKRGLEVGLTKLADKVKPEELKEAFKEFISQLFLSVVKLTGDILIQDVQKTVDEKLSKFGGGSLKTWLKK